MQITKVPLVASSSIWTLLLESPKFFLVCDSCVDATLLLIHAFNHLGPTGAMQWAQMYAPHVVGLSFS